MSKNVFGLIARLVYVLLYFIAVELFLSPASVCTSLQ